MYDAIENFKTLKGYLKNISSISFNDAIDAVRRVLSLAEWARDLIPMLAKPGEDCGKPCDTPCGEPCKCPYECDDEALEALAACATPLMQGGPAVAALPPWAYLYLLGLAEKLIEQLRKRFA
jgi:hypothetical protein